MFVQKVNVPPLRPPPQRAVDLGAAAALLFRVVQAGARALASAIARQRAAQAARRAAMHDAEERSAVLAMARRYASTQPEFAKDLVAAATSERGR